ncbi:hypothetical protein SAMN07250955_1187 [Arboricoccus pini]|uniref:Uncharacterized protein n=1 Tax=Arboricoccus pini TaxID=1963835 RepID=A0A212RZG4_9PROT|nr:hypothetical protein [Arboricoccus pini]SNB78163.1 hypothetical protein SAMN07250955_1187 [Arboricoccus pini]
MSTSSLAVLSRHVDAVVLAALDQLISEAADADTVTINPLAFAKAPASPFP